MLMLEAQVRSEAESMGISWPHAVGMNLNLLYSKRAISTYKPRQSAFKALMSHGYYSISKQNQILSKTMTNCLHHMLSKKETSNKGPGSVILYQSIGPVHHTPLRYWV